MRYVLLLCLLPFLAFTKERTVTWEKEGMDILKISLDPRYLKNDMKVKMIDDPNDYCNFSYILAYDENYKEALTNPERLALEMIRIYNNMLDIDFLSYYTKREPFIQKCIAYIAKKIKR